MERDPYVVLGVPRDADLRAIKRAFRALARKCHPDLEGEAARFREVREAYDLLSDRARREELDRGARRDAEEAALDAIFRVMFGAERRGTAEPAAPRFEGRVSGSRQVELDAFLSRAEARFGTTVPFRFHLGPRLVNADIALPPGVRTGQRLRYEVPVDGDFALTVIVHVEIED